MYPRKPTPGLVTAFSLAGQIIDSRSHRAPGFDTSQVWVF